MLALEVGEKVTVLGQKQHVLKHNLAIDDAPWSFPMLIDNKIIETYHISAGDMVFFTHLGQLIRDCTINVP